MNVSAPHLEQIEKALAFIETQLTQPLKIEDISRHVGYSLFHFCRVFNAVTYISPYNYLMRRRISEAALQVVHTRRRLTDIAVDYGFQSSEVFGRCFKRLFDRLPSELRKGKHLDERLLLPALQPAQLEAWQALRTFELALQPVDGLRLTGLLERCPKVEQEQALRQKLVNQYPAAASRTLWGMRLYPPDWQQHGPFYLAGLQAETMDIPTPAWFVEKTLPAQAFLATQRYTAADLPQVMQFIYRVWLPLSPYRVDIPFVLEKYADEPQASSAQLMLPAVKRDSTQAASGFNLNQEG